ncbi:hypothetical protein Tcan_12055 [Toxocara canis]|uniref:Uncharacterized protein n=1 Tax=Toxocara canis TaxID=6265 RepID=A0A0B2UP82_TOXCA|nr:hypothetical protein Tcan_12055 [Toxocara canis]
MATKGSDGGACSHVVEQRSTVEEKNNRTLANTVERNRFGRGTHTQSTQLPPEGCGKAKAMEDEQQMTRYASSLPEHIPRGQTRRLASAFELMAEEAIAGKDLEHRFRKAKRFPRHQSLPSRNDIHIECDRYGTLRKAQLDDSFLELQYSDDENCYICHPELQQDIAHDDNGAISACKHNWKPMLETQYVEIGGTPNVHYIANRLENAKMKNSCGSFTYLTSTTPLNSINQLTESRRYASLLDGSSKNPKLGYDLATVAMDYGVSEVVRYPSETGCYGDEHLTSIGTNNVYLYAKNEKKYKELNDVQQRDGRYYELPTEKGRLQSADNTSVEKDLAAFAHGKIIKVCDQHIGGSIQDQDMNIGQAMDQEHMTDNDTSATSLFHCADPNEMSHRFICAGKALKYCCAGMK